MDNYQLTGIWKNTLGRQCVENQLAVNRLKESFLSFRSNVTILANEIGRSLPDYTVHDITHIDALWEMADCICGVDYDLNPVEGFILGGAFLLHDLAMSLAAYPQGIIELEQLQLWTDTIAQKCKQLDIPIPISSKYNQLPENIREYVISTALRKLHASSAEKLALNAWKSTSGDIFLIDNPEIRQSFGRVIGRVAHSHWWDISKLENEFSRVIGAPSWCPRSWTIDPLKLACILRVSDASHIDSRRAPQFLRTLRKLSPTSDEHWCFQEKLQKPYLSEDSLFYTSGYSFKSSEASSWWLCYEALKMIDKELRQTDALLADRSMNRFKAKRVFGIESPERLSSLIQSEGWTPIDAFIHIGDLPKIIRNLGGEELYGKDMTVPIRELIQNSSDAIRARRKLENRSDEWGSIKISVCSEDENKYIEIEDDGIGMSLEVIKHYLFDFGNSYWGSELMLEEHPGLMAKDIKATGKYGIGFFSSFMIGDDITITTRKCNKAQEDTHVIEFRSGLNARPIIRNAMPHEYLIDGGTKIRITISNIKIFDRIFNVSSRKTLTLSELCTAIAPALDVELVISEKDNIQRIPKDNWIKCSNHEFINLLASLTHQYYEDIECTAEFLHMAAENIKYLYADSGQIIGRAFLSQAMRGDSQNLMGCMVVGGLVETRMSGISGILVGKNTNAARNDSILVANRETMSAWVSQQAQLVTRLYDHKQQMYISLIVRMLNGNPGPLPITFFEGKYINYTEIENTIKDKDEIIVIDDYFCNYRANDFDNLTYEPNIFFTPISGIPGIFHSKRINSVNDYVGDQWVFKCTGGGFIAEVVSKAWNIELSKCINVMSWQKEREKIVIAKNNGKEILERGYVFNRTQLKENE